METPNSQDIKSKKKKALMVAGSAFLIVGIALSFYLYYKAYNISTDDAFIEADIYSISSRVSGIVESVLVEDNQRVETGEVLLTLDQQDFDLRVQAEQSALEAAKAKLKELEAKVNIGELSLLEAKSMVEASRANYELKQAVLRKTEQDMQRAKVLFENEVLAKENYDNAVTAYNIAIADTKAAFEKLNQSEQALETQRAVVRQTAFEAKTQSSKIEQESVALDTAKLSKSYTSITAPGSGYVTRNNIEKGSHVNAGKPLMAVVDLDNVWIVANYKETQLGKIKPGQKVKFTIDAWPSETFTGTVDSIMAGTGAAFSVFPSENATGNYVKVVQRVPVKIVPDKGTFGQYKPRVGMSVVPVVNIR